MVVDEEGRILNKEINELIDRTQRIVEGAYFSMREYNLKLDDVINDQRRVIYSLRDKVLESDNTIKLLKEMVVDTVEFAIHDNAPEELDVSEWKHDEIERVINSLFLTPVTIDRNEPKVKRILSGNKAFS